MRFLILIPLFILTCHSNHSAEQKATAVSAKPAYETPDSATFRSMNLDHSLKFHLPIKIIDQQDLADLMCLPDSFFKGYSFIVRMRINDTLKVACEAEILP